MRRLGPLLAAALVLSPWVVLAAAGERSGAGQQPLSADDRDEARKAGEQYLAHIYAVYLALRACAEVAASEGRPEPVGSVTLEEARRAMKALDGAALEVGLEVERIWANSSPVGLVTAEHLKTLAPEAREKHCRQIGSVFRIDLGNLQRILVALGARRPVIEKDF